LTDRLVLCYHAVSPDWAWPMAIAPAQLEEQLRLLLSRGYRGVTFSDAVLGQAPAKALAVTFDDAYRSVFERACPLLGELGVPATVFACSDLVGGREPMTADLAPWAGGRWENELAAMGWDELGTLVDAGWEVGSHARSHRKLTELAEDALASELAGSKAEIERGLGVKCLSLAYPFGAYDASVVAQAAAAGYRAAATCFPGLVTNPPPLEWPRVCVSRHHTVKRFARKVSRPMRRFRGSAVGELASRAAYARRSGHAPRRPSSARASAKAP
jgi:peptidoglycan/xylan/chitin deacetylase (PgdA/CDA1 family)